MKKPPPSSQEVALALAAVRKVLPEQADVLSRAIACKALEITRQKGHIRDLERIRSIISAIAGADS